MKKKLEDSLNIVVSFDESLNKVSQRQQMDIQIRFWDSSNQEVTTRYYTSAFLGHSTAYDLLEAIKTSLPSELMKKMTQVAMDGPNVNKKLFNDLQLELSELQPDSPELLNIGTCGLHTIHGAFKTGMKATTWDIVGFLRAVYNLFKDSPARRADYIRYSKSEVFPLKFCAVRWVESGRVAERALQILPALKKYVQGVTADKKEPGCQSFIATKKQLNDKLLPAKLSFFMTMSSMFEPFLVEFQNDKPMAPFLYNEIVSLISSLVEKVVKQDYMESINNRIDKIDFAPTNLIPTKHLDLGFATKDVLKTCHSTDIEKVELKKGAKDAIVAMSKKLIDKSPVKHLFLKTISCLDPSVIKSKDAARDTKLMKSLEELVAKKWIAGTKADKIKRQYLTLFNKEHILDKCKLYKRNKTRLDNFFIEILDQEGVEDFEDLKFFIQIVLTLSHGNAAVERGFSINKECIIENLQEESLVALRQIYDGVSAEGGVESVEINKALIHSVKNAHARYTEHLENKRKALKEKSEKENEKKKALKEKRELEAEKEKLMSEARNRSAEIQEKIIEINKKMKS